MSFHLSQRRFFGGIGRLFGCLFVVELREQQAIGFFHDVVGEIPTKRLDPAVLGGAGGALTELLVLAGLATSKGQARKDIEGGGIYVNNVRATEAGRTLTPADLLFGRYVLLRKGKRTYAVLNLT